MIKKKLAIAVAVGIAALGATGCTDTISQAELDRETEREIENMANRDTLAQINKEKAELSQLLIKLREEDPSVERVYYSFDDDGDRQLNIVRQDEDGNLITTFMAGAFVGHMLSGSGDGHRTSGLYKKKDDCGVKYRNHDKEECRTRGGSGGGAYLYRGGYHMGSVSHSHADEKRFRSQANSNYVGKLKTSKTNAIKSNPAKVKSVSKGVFSRMSSARSGGYARGGGS